jgi:hypothetical protein
VKSAFRSILLCSLATVFSPCNDLVAQTKNSVSAKSRYIVVVEHKDGRTTKGVLHSIDQQVVDLINFVRHDSLIHILVASREVEAIRYRKEGKIRRHALIGLGIGAVAGVITGLATYDAHKCDFNTCVEKGVDPGTTLVLGGILGAGTGAILGARYTTIDVNGDPAKYAAAISFFENPKP